ncbi:MAG: zinc ABC transporter substrate-binding protein [Hyphomicrobiales bacterium]|nr:zinc ABC transporter substrate-binding protein [Hyphomicrobiales bacterium]
MNTGADTKRLQSLMQQTKPKNTRAALAGLVLASLLLAHTTAPTTTYAADTGQVVVTIKPIHALVAGVMKGVAVPKLLISGGGSPHAFAFKPSHARALQKARVVFRVSEALESFLNRPIENLARKATIITLDETPGIRLYAARGGGLWKRHNHAHENHTQEDNASSNHKDHESGPYDPHFWLDPVNAQKLIGHIATHLSATFPAHAGVFSDNAAHLERQLTKLDKELKAATAPLQGKPYIVLHDAYRYFEERYSLRPSGAITVSPERLPGARRLSAIRERITDAQAICVFAEPQFEPKLVLTLIEGTNARRGVLDPLGAELTPGAGLYFALMRNLAAGLSNCLAPRTQN